MGIKASQIKTSHTLGSLQPSMTLGITAKAKEMKAAGEDVVSMAAGEPDFDTPEHIKTAAVKSLEAGETKYTPVAGRPELRAAIADKLTRENAVPCEAKNVIVSPGAKFSVFTAIAVLCDEGDEVILPKPYWLSYEQMVIAAGATPVFVDTTIEDEYCLTAEKLESVVSDRTKLLVVNSPGNPSGAVYPEQMLADIADVACRRGFFVLADEIYEKLIYDSDHKHVSIASLNDEIAEQTVTVNGFSKTYSMTGWRLGYLAAPEWLVKKITALQSHTSSNPASFAQPGAMAALQGSQEPVEKMRRKFAERRELVYELLTDIKGVETFKPHGAFYIFPDISEVGIDSMTFAERILEEYKVAVIPGKPFGMDQNIRLSYACDEDTIKETCKRLKSFCEEMLK